MKKSKTTCKRVVGAEGVRDVFGRMVVVTAKMTIAFNLPHILSYPVTDMPLSLAHSQNTPLKTNKAALTKTPESRQEVAPVNTSIPSLKATVIDGGIIIHETILQHSESTYHGY